jgi:capsular polysaccharide biosynthesis protein
MAIYRSEKQISKTLVKNNLPCNFIDADLYLFEKDITKELPDVFINFANNVKVTPHGIIFNRLHIFDQFLIWPAHKKEFDLFYLIRNYFSRKELILDKNKKYIICFDYWTMGYFHWMCDFLPKILVAEKYLVDYTLVLPDNHKYNYIIDSLKIFNNIKLVSFSDNQYVSCSEAIIPDKVTPSGDNNPLIMLKIRDKFLEFYKPLRDPNLFTPNIYVSRSKAKGRFITNEREVIDVLASLGFKTIYFEDYSLEDQIKLTYNCKNLIGLHGANLTNLMFMKFDSNILELRNEGDIKNNYYYSLASSFSLNYFYLQCKSNATENDQTFNINVDIEKLIVLTKKMLAK